MTKTPFRRRGVYDVPNDSRPAPRNRVAMTPAPPLNPYDSPPAHAAVPVNTKAAARSQLFPVALALLVPSILHIFGGLFYFVYVYSVVARPGTQPDFAHPLVTYSMYYGISMLYCLL